MIPLKIAMVLPDNRDEFGKRDVPEPRFGTAPTALIAGFKQIPEIEVHLVCCLRQPARAPRQLAENIFYHGVPVPPWGFLKTGYLPAIRNIRKKLREIRPDVVHGQGTERFAALAAAHSGFPNVITIHGNMRQVARALGAKRFSFHWFTAHLEDWALRRTDGVICLTRYTQEQVQSLARKTWLVSNAVDEAYFTVQRAEAHPPRVLCVANIAPYKCQNELIEALEPLATEQNFRLVFLGAVNESTAYGQEFLKRVKARPWCVYDGFRTGAALREELGAARLLVLPSREDNCPMVLLEAMAAGAPVAASRIGGIPDLIDDSVNGLLFDPNDPAAVRTAVRRVLSDRAFAETLSGAGKRRALERHSPMEIARQHLAVYREVIS